ncbi:MAG: ABC transporter permease [Planctomycetota bacterium]
MLLRLAASNLRHRPSRVILTISGVAIASGIVLCLLGFRQGYEAALDRSIDRVGYHLLVTAPGCPYEAATLLMKGGMGFRYIQDDIVAKLKKDPRVVEVSPQLMQTAFPSDYDRFGESRSGILLFIGVEEGYFRAKPWLELEEGDFFSGSSAMEVIVGSEVARQRLRRAGDPFVIPGVGETATTVGVLKSSGTQEDGVVLMPLDTLRRLFGHEGQLTGVGLKLRNLLELENVIADLQAWPGVQLVSLAQVRSALLSMVKDAQGLLISLTVLALAVAFFGVSNTVIMSVFERMKQFAMLRVMGAMRGTVFSLILVEAALLTTAGSLLGVLLAALGVPLADDLLRAAVHFAPPGPMIQVRVQHAIVTVAGSVLLGILASLLPALRATRSRPIHALRSEG